VSDSTAASKDKNNRIFCAVLDVTAASNTENSHLCKQTIMLMCKDGFSRCLKYNLRSLSGKMGNFFRNLQAMEDINQIHPLHFTKKTLLSCRQIKQPSLN
jgi:hypothetical protein